MKQRFLNGAPFARRPGSGASRRGNFRGIGGGEQRPPGFGDLLMWWDGQDDDTYTITGQGLASWVDKIAGVDAVQGTDSSRPLVDDSNVYFKGRRTFSFPVNQTFLDAEGDPNFPTAALNTGDWTFIVACRSLSADLSKTFLEVTDGGVVTQNSILMKDDRATHALRVFTTAGGTGGAVNSSGNSFTPLGFNAIGWGADGVSAFSYTRDIGRESAASALTPTGLDSIRIGARRLNGGEAGSDIAEILVYDHALSVLEYNAALQYLDNRYRPALVPVQEGVQNWWDPRENGLIGIDTGVDSYIDRVGGVELLQPTPGLQPTVEFSERLGHQALRYDGSQFLDNASLGGTAVAGIFEAQKDHTVYAQYVHEGAGPLDIMFGASLAGSSGNERSVLRHVVNANGDFMQYIHFGDAVEKASNLATGTAPGLAANWVMGGIDGTNVRVSGRTSETPSTTAIGLAELDVVDSISIGSVNGFSIFEGVIGQVMLFDYALTTAQRTRVEAYLEELSAGVETSLRLGAAAHFDPAQQVTDIAGEADDWTDVIGGAVMTAPSAGERPPIVETSLRTGHRMLGFTRTTGHRLVGTTALAEVFRDQKAWTVYGEFVQGTDRGGNEAVMWAAFEAGASATENAQGVLVGGAGTGFPQTNYRDAATAVFKAAGGIAPARAARWARFASTGVNLECEATGLGEGINPFGAVSPSLLDTFGIGTRAADREWDGEIGNLYVFGHDLNDADRATMEAHIESLWTAGVPLRLGADINLDGEDLTTAAWPDRVGGPDFVPTTAFQLGTLNGRPSAVFDGTYSASRTDATADTSRGNHTMAVVLDHVSTGGADREFLNHFQAAGDGSDNRVGYGHSTGDATVFTREDANQTKNTFTAVSNTTGDRNILIMSFDDATDKANVHLNGAVADVRTNTKALSVTQDTTRISGRQGGGFEHLGAIAFIAQFGHVMNDQDREQLDGYLSSRYFDWAAAENTPGAIDDIQARFKAADYDPVTGDWPSFEGSLHPIAFGNVNAGERPTKGTTAVLGGAPVVEFDGINDSLFSDFGEFEIPESFLGFAGVMGAKVDERLWVVDNVTGFWIVNMSSGAVQYRTNNGTTTTAGATTETVGDGDALVFLATASESGWAAKIVLSGTVSSFTGAPKTMTTMKNVTIGVFAGTFMDVLASEYVSGTRNLGTAELVAWQRYADETYLDPGLVA